MSGAVVWFTGLPGAGKTTLAHWVRDELATARMPVVLDSDEVRIALGMTHYDRASRDAFYAALANLAVLLAHQGHVVLVAATASKRHYRDAARTAPKYVEVYVATAKELCDVRDRKGLYARAQHGELTAFPGLDEDYEAPEHPDFVADGGHDGITAKAIAARLR